ncbi:MAG: 2-succinyl-6-hydroxy-2,4-cyclohexadiene-1-carboxylate synthase [Acidimicrobiaceae bacterium]|nr:2-succinyl-6-hydroxy-2,4-cyclohexadiene-1-carboxylate synthase [Acidimicrobiaceae bacterium]MXZ64508.1 2-succinyl-6-hydroxy-2,4-cyclohexadiene-1-carboxylate synthase [Acidimicrobiaceae bacterium]MYF33777.1 2-succinyl-6-hydroxy-2,4-cyclohexadiene-1-carboxylate synthase [Acidimicrobiaceae bacterium]MYJ85205.1 2-succinyl-6-hydroxy-2,4-cyclohexadiene-1-carboxylate synthase [Acidimicrobiaceae bacterium]
MRTDRAFRIRAGGVELAVSERGPQGGMPILVLHGFTGSSAAMEPLVERLAAGLAGRVICPDLIGHGDSEVPDDIDRYRVEAMAGQVAGLADALDCETFHLVGYSMGGRVALTLGCTQPQRLQSLALIGASAGISDPAERRRRAGADRSRADRIVEDFEAFVEGWMADPLFAGQAALGHAHRQAARAQRLASSPAGLARSLLAGGTGSMTPLHSRLKDCEVPVLALAGAQDAKFCAIAAELATVLPDCAAVRVEGAGHAAHLEQPDAAAAAIAGFIADTANLADSESTSGAEALPARPARPAG